MTKNDAFKEKWMLRKTISCLFHNPDEVTLAEGLWNGRIYEVRDEKRCGKLAKAIQLLDGTKTVEQIIDEIKDMSVLNIIEELNRNGLLIKVEDAADREPPAFELFFGFSEDKLRQISPLIIGDGQLAQILAHQLSLMNIESRLSRTSDVNDSLLKENSYIVVLSDNPQPYFYNLINDLCLKKRIKWTLGLFDGAYAVITTFIPFETACYVCFEHRIESTLPIHQMDSYLRFKRSLSSYDLIRPPIPPIFAEMVAAFIAVEVIKVIGYEAGDYSGKALFIHLPTLTFELNDVFKLPRCKACGKEARGKPSHQLYVTMRKLLNLLDGE
ncbi:MAG: TOMM precursor leader peptide-binding protein [Thermoproteota archaeon]